MASTSHSFERLYTLAAAHAAVAGLSVDIQATALLGQTIELAGADFTYKLTLQDGTTELLELKDFIEPEADMPANGVKNGLRESFQPNREQSSHLSATSRSLNDEGTLCNMLDVLAAAMALQGYAIWKSGTLSLII